MIGYLRGQVLEREPTRLLLDVQGVGYIVYVPLTLHAAVGQVLSLRIYTHVTDDQITLYGFEDARQLRLFEYLLKVQGVGPRIGMSILSHMTPDEFVQIVRQRDARRLREIPGVGPKVSERLVVELAPVMDRWIMACEKVPSPTAVSQGRWQEVLQALEVLGYNRREVEALVRDVLQQSSPDEPLEDVLRKVLRRKAAS
ncbi:MAG: Holliday junction branch migration protein RuvA [Acidobacteria bacterium]|nr:Holliday junction branch migration protein RuvA [Acidobacteriota bacterium]MDW7984978.1 Holliday junction branch migration protein RuvA [Acidobacteriota bacterium]